jgi:CDP-4-dehydro-6-deoxyglucose reductase, E1
MPERIKEEILKLVESYYEKTKKEVECFKMPVSGKVYDQKELQYLVESSLEGWWTEGKWNKIFEEKLKKFIGAKFALTVNSGSSANLVAMKTLTSIKLKEKRILPGDEVITLAAGFPTTINPIINIGAIPVFVDINLGTYDAPVDQIRKAISPKTKAIIMAHTLGNPFNLTEVQKICQEHNLWLIEDNCDALGSKYGEIYTGTFGDLSTLSFYPAHHITTAEGGAVITNNPQLYKIAVSIRDWGRDCHCPTGKDNACGKRFEMQLGNLPWGYDHKYTYSELGFNLKLTDLQASIGVAQLEKLELFIKKRKDNFKYLYSKLEEFKEYFILPTATANSDPSWFGFPITLKDGKIKREHLIHFLNENQIATRLLFAGNVLKQPYFTENNFEYRVVGDLKNTDQIMNNTFWIGVYPGIGKKHLDYCYNIFKKYMTTIK